MTRLLRTLSIIALLALTLQGCGPGNAPAGQPPMITMTAEAMETLQEQFNAAPEATRVVLLLSPT